MRLDGLVKSEGRQGRQAEGRVAERRASGPGPLLAASGRANEQASTQMEDESQSKQIWSQMTKKSRLVWARDVVQSGGVRRVTVWGGREGG